MASQEGDIEEKEDSEGEDGGEITEQVEQFFSELNVQYERQRKLVKSDGIRIPRRRSTLPSHLHSVMGSANLSLARGDMEAAIELCMEVIRQAPHVVEPFLTLATVYEDMGQKEKLYQMILISAHMKRSDCKLWTKAAELSVELNQLPIAAQCFSRAYRLDKGNVTLLWQRARIYQELQEWKNAINCYITLRETLTEDSGTDYVEISKELARIYHQQSENVQAVDALQKAFDKYFDFFDDEAMNILTELLLSLKRFKETFELITSYYDLSFVKTTLKVTAQTQHPLSLEEPLSLSAALSMSMGTDDDLNRAIEPFGGQVGGLLTSNQQTDDGVFEATELPDTVPIDLRAKLTVCMIHLKYQFSENVLLPLSSNPEDYGDLLLDIAEAFMENLNYSKALPLLTTLTETKEFNQAGVWLKHAECLHMLHELEPAALSYSKVLSLAPHHTETRMTLASLYSQLGMTEDALALLDAEDHLYNLQDEDGSNNEPAPQQPSLSVDTQEVTVNTAVTTAVPVVPPLLGDLRLSLTKFLLLVGEERLNEYCEVGLNMLTFYFRHYYERNDLRDLAGCSKRGIRSKIGRITTGTVEEEKTFKEQENLISNEEWWKIFSKTCKGLYKLRHYDVMMQLILCADVSKKLETYRESILLMSSSACLLMGDTNFFHYIRLLYFKKSDFPLFWNMFNCMGPHSKHHRFVLRQLIKNPSHMLLTRISGNYSLLNTSYKFALAQYELAYRSNSEDYLLCLCISIVYLHLVIQKHTLNKNALVIQSVSFLHKYLRLRGPCQESYYNIGRLFHQIGLLHIACQYYKKVLSLEPEKLSHGSSKEEMETIHQLSDLKYEAAFNLSLIYRNSGNKPLALHYLRHFCKM